MSPRQPEQIALALAQSPPSQPAASASPIHEIEAKAGSLSLDGLTAEDIREIVRLLQCPQCSLPLREPITLPCGKSLCKQCLPEIHDRTNISYPGTANRLQGFECPFPDCGKDHAIGDCSVDVTLNKALTLLRSELQAASQDAVVLQAQIVVSAVEKDEWEVAGVPSLKEAGPPRRQLRGGRVLATYSLVESGELRYRSEVTYEVTEVASDITRNADWSILKAMESSMRVEMDCQICYALIYEPLTTPCGHTFCRHCLDRVLDHAVICPVCRRTLTVQPQIQRHAYPSNELLKRITTIFWSEDLEARKQFIVSEGLGDNNAYDIPVFVCTLAFPHMPTFLHIFEPRYRLMIRRAMQGNQTFGMVNYRRQRSPSDRNFEGLGTLLRIINADFFPDGRSLIETVGVSRFRVIDHGMHDGYVVARTVKINDLSIAEEEELEASETRVVQTPTDLVMEDVTAGGGGRVSTSPTTTSPMSPSSPTSPTRPSLTVDMTVFDTKSTRELMDFAVNFVQRMRGQSVTWLTHRILAIYGDCPDDPAHFPWWLASILPVKDEEKYRLLSTTSVRQRLKICCGWILEWESTRGPRSSCSIL